MTNFEVVLVKRDGLSFSQARACREEARDTIYRMLEEGASDFLIEDYLMSEFGLELDYITDLLDIC